MGLPPPAVTPAALVPASEGGVAPSRRHSRRPSRPRRRRDDPSRRHSRHPGRPCRRRDDPSRRHSRHPSRPRRRWGYPLPPSFSAPQSSPPKVGLPPPAVILGTPVGCRESRETKATTLALPLNINRGCPLPPSFSAPSRPRRRRDDWVPGIQRNKGNHLGTPAKHQQGLPPPAVILGTPVGCRESRGTKATTLALPLNINRGCPLPPSFSAPQWGAGNPEEQRQPPWHSR